jgi:hypothetical protein
MSENAIERILAMTQDNIVNGKGKVYFAPFLAGTQTAAALRFVGNAPELAVTSNPTFLDHFASTGGVKVKDQSVAIQVDRTGTLMVDNISKENLAIMFFGAASVLAQVAGPVVAEPHGVDALDRFVRLGITEANPSGVRAVTAVVVKDAAGLITYALGTDYTVNAALGMIYIPKTSAIPAASTIKVDYTLPARQIEQVISGTTPIEGTLFFESNNPAGENKDFLMPWVKLTPNGDFNLIADDWQKISFKLEVLKRSDQEAYYVSGR